MIDKESAHKIIQEKLAEKDIQPAKDAGWIL